MTRTIYFGDGAGNWVRRTWKPQCSFKGFMFSGQCQGARGHEGEHWHYQEDGQYEWHIKGKAANRFSCVGSQIPPGHKEWVHPETKWPDHHLTCFSDSVVTNKKLIARLNAGECNEGEAIDQPCDFNLETAKRSANET